MLLNIEYFIPLEKSNGIFLVIKSKNDLYYIFFKNGRIEKFQTFDLFSDYVKKIEEYEILFLEDVKLKLIEILKKFLVYYDFEYKKSLKRDITNDIETLKSLLKGE